MKLYLLREKGKELHKNLFDRKGILLSVYQFFKKKYKYRNQNQDDFEIVEVEIVEKNSYNIEEFKKKKWLN